MHSFFKANRPDSDREQATYLHSVDTISLPVNAMEAQVFDNLFGLIQMSLKLSDKTANLIIWVIIAMTENLSPHSGNRSHCEVAP
jgi:hypothetical protein